MERGVEGGSGREGVGKRMSECLGGVGEQGTG